MVYRNKTVVLYALLTGRHDRAMFHAVYRVFFSMSLGQGAGG